MKYQILKDWPDGYSTSLQGYLNITYKEITDKLGKPVEDFDDYKSDAEWRVMFDGGTYATIYNYKDGKNYLGAEGTPKTKITEWHIGGEGQLARDLVEMLFGIVPMEFEEVEEL